MRKNIRRVLAAVMAVAIMGSVSQTQIAYAASYIPPADRILPGQVERNLTVPNSINVLVKDADGTQLKGGKFQLIAEDGTVVKSWTGGDGIYSATNGHYADEDRCPLPASACYEVGDYDGEIRFPYEWGYTKLDRDGWDSLNYGTNERYVAYGDKMTGMESVTIPAGEVWINVGAGYKREPGQDKAKQIIDYADQYTYDLSNIAGTITKLHWPAGTQYGCGISMSTDGETSVKTHGKNMLTSYDTAGEYVKVTLDFHKYYERYVNAEGKYVMDDKTFVYGAPSVDGAFTTMTYLQLTSGAVTNFVSLMNGPTAEVYLKKGDYEPSVSCTVVYKHNSGMNSGSGGGNDGIGLTIYDYMKHIIHVVRPPEKGATIGYIPAGTYTLHQVSAAEGYLPAADRKITVKDSAQVEDLQKIEVVNEKEKPHEHTFSPEWSKDHLNHWHVATCGHSHVVADKAAHTFGAWNVVVKPTETQEGRQERSCTVCGFKQEKSIAKLPHEHTFSPDWRADEQNHWHAATCGHSNVADKAAHTYGEWNVVVKPTEAQEGRRERSCTVCGFKQREKLDKLPHEHTFSPDWSKDEQNHWHAATCEHSNEVADKAAHTYGEWKVVREATEQQEGLRERSCTVCGYKQEESIAKLPHEHTFSPDWSKDEQNHWHAATCEHSDLVKDKAVHTYGEWKVVREATEQQEGLRERSCTVCGFKQEESIAKLPHEHTFSPDWSKDEQNHWHAATCEHSNEVADKAAHTYGAWNVVREATEQQEGLRERSCTVCGFKQEESIAKLPHEHTFSSDWSKDEQNHWHAATCEHSNEVADKAAHTYGDWKVVREATEQQEGLRERSCTVCGFKQEESIAKLPHEHTFSPDWSKDEQNHWHAATCEHSDVVADKAAHTYGDWNVVREATEQQEGLQERSCTVCGATQQVTIEKLPTQTPQNDPQQPSAPQTGDNSRVALWAAVAVVTVAAFVVMIVYRKRR